jgi:hypothetical protein
MMMPMVGFLFALIVVGGLASLIAKADPHARLAPFLGFPLLFAGLAAFCLSMGLGTLGEYLDRTLGTHFLSGLGFLGGYTLGGLGGALLGLRKALKQK